MLINKSHLFSVSSIVLERLDLSITEGSRDIVVDSINLVLRW